LRQQVAFKRRYLPKFPRHYTAAENIVHFNIIQQSAQQFVKLFPSVLMFKMSAFFSLSVFDIRNFDLIHLTIVIAMMMMMMKMIMIIIT
jgi:hypothetical protein